MRTYFNFTFAEMVRAPTNVLANFQFTRRISRYHKRDLPYVSLERLSCRLRASANAWQFLALPDQASGTEPADLGIWPPRSKRFAIGWLVIRVHSPAPTNSKVVRIFPATGLIHNRCPFFVFALLERHFSDSRHPPNWAKTWTKTWTPTLLFGMWVSRFLFGCPGFWLLAADEAGVIAPRAQHTPRAPRAALLARTAALGRGCFRSTLFGHSRLRAPITGIGRVGRRAPGLPDSGRPVVPAATRRRCGRWTCCPNPYSGM